MSIETAFGVSRYLEDERRHAIANFLTAAWQLQFGARPADLEADLAALRRLFRPDLTGKVARAEFVELPRLALERPKGLPDAALIELPGARGLITPEGRLLLDLISGPSSTISDEDLLSAHARLSEFYGVAYRERLLAIADGGDLRPNTIGFVLFLILNGSIGPERAFRIPEDSEQEAQLAAALFEVLDAFADGLGATPLVAGQRRRLRSNWVLTESSAQLPLFVSHEGDRYWLLEDTAPEVAEHLGGLLAARRDATPAATFEAALAASAEAYRQARPTLAAMSLAHDRPNRTTNELNRLAAAYRSSHGP
jgi:hypothetical protein